MFCQCKFYYWQWNFNLNGTKLLKLIIPFCGKFRYFLIKQVCIWICIFYFRKMELKFELLQLKGKGNWIVKFFVIKVEKEGRSLVFGILVLVLLWFLTRNGIWLNSFAYDSFLKILCLGYFDQYENSSNEYELCIELNGKEPKKIYVDENWRWCLVCCFILRLNWSILMIGCQSLWIKQIWMQKLMLKDFWNS